MSSGTKAASVCGRFKDRSQCPHQYAAPVQIFGEQFSEFRFLNDTMEVYYVGIHDRNTHIYAIPDCRKS